MNIYVGWNQLAFHTDYTIINPKGEDESDALENAGKTNFNIAMETKRANGPKSYC